MNDLVVNIPMAFKEFVVDQVASGFYADANDLVCSLLRQEQKRLAKEIVEKKLLEALESGETVEMTPSDWSEIRAEARSRYADQNGDKR